jgi:MFS transporter, PHS family, inorganic phosphate transporter
MMAAVFLMQPLGQILAAGVGWGVLAKLARSGGLDQLPANGADLTDDQKKAILSTIDRIWRCVIGVGAFPAFLAILWRFSIPESPRYTMDVDRDAKRAYLNLRLHNGKEDDERTMRNVRAGIPPDQQTAQRNAAGNARGNATANSPGNTNGYAAGDAHGNVRSNAAGNGAPEITFKSHFWDEGNCRYLFATAFCWFVLDFAFHALGINNPRQIGAIWDSSLPAPENHGTAYDWPATQFIAANHPLFSVPDWQNPFDPNTNMYHELYDSAKQYIVTISCGSLAGSILLIFIIEYIPRKMWLVWSFVGLSLLFAIMGGFFAAVEFTPRHSLTVVWYALCQFLFNLGEFISRPCINFLALY